MSIVVGSSTVEPVKDLLGSAELVAFGTASGWALNSWQNSRDRTRQAATHGPAGGVGERPVRHLRDNLSASQVHLVNHSPVVVRDVVARLVSVDGTAIDSERSPALAPGESIYVTSSGSVETMTAEGDFRIDRVGWRLDLAGKLRHTRKRLPSLSGRSRRPTDGGPRR